MAEKYLKLYIVALIFGFIQICADFIKAIYELNFFMIAFMGLMLGVMVWLLRWAVRSNKRQRMKHDTQSKSEKQSA